MKRLVAVALALTSAAAIAAPEVQIQSFAQAADRTVTLTYTLAGRAIVTLSAEVEVDGAWRPLDDEALWCVSGDVNREVAATAAGEVRTIEWKPDYTKSGTSLGTANIRPILTSWPTDDPPDYMVVDLSETSTDRVRYYTSTNAFPGGLLDNVAYRTTLLVLRKVPARGVTWTMGSVSESGRNPDAASGTDPEKTHEVAFDSNYYMAIFPTTQGQWAMIKGTGLSSKHVDEPRLLRPMEQTSYCVVRENTSHAENSTYQYPAGPHPSSFLGILRSRTQLDFDLPSDAEWEYACRAGNGEGLWGNGKVYENRNSRDDRVPGRYQYNQPTSSATTAPVGSYEPNSWGIYDMHGNVFEWCLDWYKADITELNGTVNTTGGTSHTNGAKMRVRRGGSYGLPVRYLRSAVRLPEPSTAISQVDGFRVKLGAAISAQ